MAYIEYVKIWTSMRRDAWFMSLSLAERGLFFQLILAAKDAENSAPKFKSWRAMGLECGCDGKTAWRMLRKFRTDGKVELTEDENGIIHVRLTNYQFWQELTPTKEGRNKLKKAPVVAELDGKILQLNRQKLKTEAEEEAPPKPDPSLLELFNAWMLAHENDLIPYFELHYAHVGGIKQLKSVASEIRESIILSPDHERWEKRKRDGQWGDTIRNWNRNSIKASA